MKIQSQSSVRLLQTTKLFLCPFQKSREEVATGEYTQEVRYYVTSLENTKPEEIASAIRQHWSTENNLHWQLDVTFRKDYSKKVKNAARNFSVATKMALTILKNEKTTKGFFPKKRCRQLPTYIFREILNTTTFL